MTRRMDTSSDATGSRHVIVTRFAVPLEVSSSAADRHDDEEWLRTRLELFRRFFVPSVERLGVPAVLLCGSRAAEFVDQRTADLDWVRIEVQDDWRGGWTGASGEFLTRLDSDDAIRGTWFEEVDRAPAEVEVCISKEHLRLDVRRGRLHRYERNEPSPLAAFRAGRNPYLHDHKHLEAHYRTHRIPGAHLLQVVHGGNLSSRPPRPWRLDRRVPHERLDAFGIPRLAASTSGSETAK